MYVHGHLGRVFIFLHGHAVDDWVWQYRASDNCFAIDDQRPHVDECCVSTVEWASCVVCGRVELGPFNVACCNCVHEVLRS